MDISARGEIEKEINQLRSDIQQTNQEINKRKRRSEEFKFIEQSYLKERDVLLNLQGVKGVCGFLKDLGTVETVEKGYEDAVDASTKSFSSIVVENTIVAEECVSIINQRKLNRTTFIILDKLENSLPKVKLEEANGLLYKKIKCDAKFEKCFYFALKDTLVVRTTEEAKTLAFGRVRRRVVTVDVKLFEKSGVMSGGKPFKKIKSSHELEDLCKKMNALLEEKLGQIQEIDNLRALIKHSEDISKEIATNKLKNDGKLILNLEKEIEKIKNDVVELENKSLPLKAAELKGDIRMLNEKINFLQRSNQEIKIKLNCAPTGNIKALENELEKCNLEIGQVEMDLIPSVEILNDLEREYKHASQEFKAIHEEVNKLREEMGNDYHEEAECKSKLEDTDDKLNECYRISENFRIKVNELNMMLLSAYAFCTVNNSQLASLTFCTSDSVDFHTSDDGSDSGAIAPSMACLGNRNFRRRAFDLSFLDDDCKLGGKISCLGEKKMGKKEVTFNFESVSRESQSLSASNKSVDSNDTKEIKHGKSIKGILKTPSGTSVQSNK